MLTPVERVMSLKSIDLLANVGPRHLIKLAGVAREVPMWKAQAIYEERDLSEAIYVVVSLADDEPAVLAWRIVDGAVHAVELLVGGPT